MSGLWITIAAISVFVAAGIAWAMTRAGSGQVARRADYDLSVFKDQLAEVDRDLERGVLGETEAKAARTEIERRILAIADDKDGDGAPAPGTSKFRPSTLAISLLIPVAAVALYLHLGAPSVPNAPYAARNIAAEQKVTEDSQRAGEMGKLAASLAKRLAVEPNNIKGWLLLGRSYLALNRDEDAVAALKKAHDLNPANTEITVEYAEVMILANRQRINDEAAALLTQVAKAEPSNPRALFYLGLRKAQQSDLKGALQDWVNLVALSPKGSAWLPSVRQQIAAVGRELGVDPASVEPTVKPVAAAAPSMPSSSPAGPSADDVKAAAEMSADDRNEMIRGMVQRLADRLKENPDDLAGWQRLLKAYRVLGDEKKAAEVEARIKALQERPAASPPPQPTQEQVDAAAGMGIKDRNEMIRGMVQRLADRLKENPDDLAGWQRLLKAYRVLGDENKAAEVEARIKALTQ